MNRLLLVAVLFAVLMTVTASAEELSEAGKQELNKLAGNWQIALVMQDGKKQEPQANLTKFRVEEDKLLIAGKEVGLRITLLDPTTKPRIVNIEHPETKKKLEGIYELEKDRWRICINVEGTADRPGSFETEGKIKFVLVELEREEK